MTSPLVLILELSVVGVAVAASATWLRIYLLVKGPARNISLAILMIGIAVAAHGVEEIGVAARWTEPMVLVASVAAASFWLDASFDIAQGEL